MLYSENYGIPKNHVFLENELVHIDNIVKPLTENYTNLVIQSMVNEFVDIILNGIKEMKIKSLRQLLAISFLSIPFMNTQLVKNKAKAETIIKSNAFSLGLVGGIGFAYWAFAKSQSYDFKKSLLQKLATEGLIYTIRLNPKLNLLLYSIVNKVAVSFLKMPDHETYLKDFLVKPDVLFNPKYLVRSFFVNFIVGLIVGFFVFRYTYRKFIDVDANVSLFQVFMNHIPSDMKELAISAINDDLKSIAKSLKSLNSIKTSRSESNTVKDLLSLYETFVFSTAYKLNKHIMNRDIIASINSKKHVIHKFKSNLTNSPERIQRIDLLLTKIEQAVSIVQSLVPKFNDYVYNIFVVAQDHDTAFIKLSKTHKGKCEIYIVVNRDLYSSVWFELSVREIAAVISHEYGHFYGGAFSLLPAVKLAFISDVIATALFNDNLINVLSRAAMAYSTISFFKLAEIQADAFAIKLGLGKELKSALEKMVSTDTLLDEFGQLTTHGGNLSRIRGIEKWAKLYPELKKKARLVEK